jgi:hypothetical protein
LGEGLFVCLPFNDYAELTKYAPARRNDGGQTMCQGLNKKCSIVSSAARKNHPAGMVEQMSGNAGTGNRILRHPVILREGRDSAR